MENSSRDSFRSRVASRQSLRGRIGVRAFLFLVLSISTVVPVSLLGFNQAQRWAKSEIEATDRQAQAAAQSSSDLLSLAMLSYLHAGESLSGQVMARGDLKREFLQPIVNAHLAHHPEFLGAYVADENGLSLLNQSWMGEVMDVRINYADRDYFKELLRTKRPLISRAGIGRATHVLSVQIVAPIFNRERQFAGYTCSSVDLAEITNQAKQSVKGMTNGRLLIFDSSGQKIADSSGDSRLMQPAGERLPIFDPVAPGQSQLRIGEDEKHQAIRGIAVGVPFPIAGWRVVAVSPQASIDAHARRVKYQTATAAVVLILLALGLSAWVATWIARPLRALAATAQAVTDGEFRAMPDILRGVPFEMAQLTQSVRSMITSLREHTQDLESQVALRTEALSLANQELTVALATIRQNEQKIRDDISKARLFQEKMLPVVPAREDMDIAIHYTPLEQVSGDIFDIAEVSENCTRIFVADAVGHGVQASMRTILLKSAYDRIKLQVSSPSSVLATLNSYLVRHFPDGDLHCAASCVDIRVTAHGNEIVYANAANCPLFVFTPSTKFQEFYEAGPLLGVDEVEIRESEAVRFEPGQLLLVATDGLVEQSNESRERFESRLSSISFRASDTASSFVSRMMAHFEVFRGEQPVGDDVTLIAVLLKPRTKKA